MSSAFSKIWDPISQMDGYSTTQSPVHTFQSKWHIFSLSQSRRFLDVSTAKRQECKLVQIYHFAAGNSTENKQVFSVSVLIV